MASAEFEAFLYSANPPTPQPPLHEGEKQPCFSKGGAGSRRNATGRSGNDPWSRFKSKMRGLVVLSGFATCQRVALTSQDGWRCATTGAASLFVSAELGFSPLSRFLLKKHGKRSASGPEGGIPVVKWAPQLGMWATRRVVQAAGDMSCVGPTCPPGAKRARPPRGWVLSAEKYPLHCDKYLPNKK